MRGPFHARCREVPGRPDPRPGRSERADPEAPVVGRPVHTAALAYETRGDVHTVGRPWSLHDIRRAGDREGLAPAGRESGTSGAEESAPGLAGRSGDGSTDTPGSVIARRRRHASSDHPSTDAVADALKRPTRALGRAALDRALSGLAPGGVYRAVPVTRHAGGLLHRLFTLTARAGRGLQRERFLFCGTGLRVTPSGRYPPPCPAEPGRSSVERMLSPRPTRPPGRPIR